MVGSAAAMFVRRTGWGGPQIEVEGGPTVAGLVPAWGRIDVAAHEGPRPQITIAPGTVAISWPDLARRERTLERAERARQARVSELARYQAEYCDDPAELEPSREVTGWSRKSRANMTRTLAELDYGPLLELGLRLPMVTLTYPGDWLTVAPNGKAAKKHLLDFWKAFARAWGFDWLGLWKQEFQRRGAPHFHLWGPEPKGPAGEHRRVSHAADLLAWEASGRKGRKPYYRSAVGDGLEFKRWVSLTWAEIVAHPNPEERRRHLLAGTGVDGDEGDRMVDPRRLAVYFTKHGSFSAKEYQHIVPVAWREPGKGPGRFWGYRGLEKATQGVELTPTEAVWAGRLLRRYAAAQGVTRQVSVQRVNTRTGVVRYRTVRRPVVRLGNGRGFLCVNDGPGLAASLARALDVLRGEF